jgi:hypothetical protein
MKMRPLKTSTTTPVELCDEWLRSLYVKMYEIMLKEGLVPDIKEATECPPPNKHS